MGFAGNASYSIYMFASLILYVKFNNMELIFLRWHFSWRQRQLTQNLCTKIEFVLDVELNELLRLNWKIESIRHINQSFYTWTRMNKNIQSSFVKCWNWMEWSNCVHLIEKYATRFWELEIWMCISLSSIPSFDDWKRKRIRTDQFSAIGNHRK